MKILIFGADGMLGTDLTRTLSKDYEVIESLEKNLDITEQAKVIDFISQTKSEWVINTAAYTDVDGCETNREKAFAVNAEVPKNIALGCKRSGAKLIHLSTDYVFDGTRKEPYTEEDEPNPINIYGASKLEGERNIQMAIKNYIIVRTQWLFGKNGKNFVDTMLKLFGERDEIKVVNDQIGSPTYTLDLSQAVKKLIEVNPIFGIYNITNSGFASWYEFAREIVALKSIQKVKIIPVSLEEFPRPAKRPKNSRLMTGKFNKIANYTLRNWKESLLNYLVSPKV